MSSKVNSHFKNNYTAEIKITKFQLYILDLIKKYSFIRNLNMFKQYKVILELPKNAKVLDVGCGDGIKLKIINYLRKDVELYGVDITSKSKFLPKNVKFRVMLGDNLKFKNEIFDLVLSFHVLEHVFNAQDFVNEMERVLKIAGKMIIETPHANSILFPGENNFYIDPTHFRPFTKRSLRRMLEVNGNMKTLFVESFRAAKLPWYAYIPFIPYSIIRRGFWISIFNLFLKNQAFIIGIKRK